MEKINIGGGWSAREPFVKYAGMIGEIYGGGEYAVSESDLLSINPDTSYNILVIGGADPNIVRGEKARGEKARGEKAHDDETYSASTVEIELRDLFQFPKKKREEIKKRILSRRKKGKKVKVGGGNSQIVMKLQDAEDAELRKMLEDTKENSHAAKYNSAKTTHDTTGVDDYDIARAIDNSDELRASRESSDDSFSHSESSDDSTDSSESSSESSDDSASHGENADKSKDSSKDSTDIENTDRAKKEGSMAEPTAEDSTRENTNIFLLGAIVN